MKATMRRNGLMMLTLRLQFHVDRYDVINRVTEMIVHDGEELPTNRNALMKLVRVHAERRGVYAIIDVDDDDRDEWDQVKAAVTDRVDELFPELLTTVNRKAATR